MTLCQTSYSLLSCGLILSLPILIAIDLPILAQAQLERHDVFGRPGNQRQAGGGLEEVVLVSTSGVDNHQPVRPEILKTGDRVLTGSNSNSNNNKNNNSNNKRQQAHGRLVRTTDEQQQQQQQQQVGAGLAGYLLAEATDLQLNLTNPVDAKLSGILDRIGPDMRPLRDFSHTSADITLDVAKRAWILMHHHAQTAALDKLSFTRPLVEEALKTAKVSPQCLLAAQKTIEAGEKLQSWAIQLLNAWGNFPPVGIYEGTFGDIGSFHACVNVPENPSIGHAHYCTISYRPVLAARKNYELIIRRESMEMLHLFDDKPTNNNNNSSNDSFPSEAADSHDDAFSELLRNAQYSHYVYYKFGTCFPIQCSPNDVQKVARLMARRSILMTGPVKCHSKYANDYEEPQLISSSTSSSTSSAHSTSATASKVLQISTRDLNNGVYIWKPHITRVQIIALILIASISLIVITLTFVDIAANRVPNLYRRINSKQQNSTRNKAAMKPVGKLSPDTAELQSALLTEQVALSDLNNNNSNSNGSFKLRNLPECDQQEIRTIENEFKIETLSASGGGSGATNGINLQRMRAKEEQSKSTQERSLFMTIVDDYSIVNNATEFFKVSESQLKNDILCLNGIRCITMSWIIITHTMQYNDWSAFARIREVETHLQSLINQPLFNASYLVDTFFLVSGLLTSFSSFKLKRRRNDLDKSETTTTLSTKKNDINLLLKQQFSSTSYLIGRYLRLTPQILFISLLFILLPLASKSGGPHWYTMTGEYSENCSQNWWINLLHLQAFYRSNEMCNFVSWWISVDMFYHLFALALILIILTYGNRFGFLTCASLVGCFSVIQAIRHYHYELPPNLLSTIPQTGAMWSKMTLEFFWTPQAHLIPFFLGFFIGYLMVNEEKFIKSWLTVKRSIFNWFLTLSLLIMVSYGTYFWVIGKWNYSPLISTIFYTLCPIIWSTCLSWIIIACHFGFGAWINQLLSCKLFIILGKASYIVYLSHFLILFTFFGSQNLLLEPTQLVMFYVIFGNICLSMLFGSFLCIMFEMPWLKTQKRLMKYVS